MTNYFLIFMDSVYTKAYIYIILMGLKLYIDIFVQVGSYFFSPK